MTGHHERPESEECACEPAQAPSPGWQPCRWRPITWGDVPMLLAIFREPGDTKSAEVLTAITALGKALSRDVKKLEKMIMATQSDIDAVTAALVQEDSDLNAAVASLTAADTAIAAEIAALQAANPALDLSGLQAELASSQAASAAVAAAVSATAALVPPAV